MRYKTYEYTEGTKKEVRRLVWFWTVFALALAAWDGFFEHDWGGAAFKIIWYLCVVIPFFIWWERRKDRRKQDKDLTI